MVLSKEKLMELNTSMLGLGAPIEIDNQGYNQAHYNKMAGLAYRTSLSDRDAYNIAVVLMTYSKTQLTSYAADIKETIDFYQTDLKQVKVVDYDKKSVKISWEFNQNISNFIKSEFDRTNFRWVKDNGWFLIVKWSGVDALAQRFTNEGFDVTQMLMIQSNLDTLFPETDEEPETKELNVEVKVARPSDTIDTLEITCDYNKNLVDAFHEVPFMFFNKTAKTWECYIEYSYKLYEALKEAGVSDKNLATLKPWADMVKGWETNYTLMDVNSLNLKFKPYDFQPKDSAELLAKKWMLNANEMGCGKTFEQVVIGESIPMKKLVICPPTLRINWSKEIKMVNPDANIHIIYSADNFKVVDGWNIIGYTSVDKFQKELESENFQVIMVDEAHYCQAVSNAGTPESKRAYGVLRLTATANYVFPITGTPKTNRNKNIYNILRMVRHPLTRGKWAFANYGRTFCDGQNNGWGWDYNGNSNDEQLNEQLKPFMVRHLKKDVLPDLKKQRIMVPVQVDLREYRYEISQYLQNRTNKNSEDLARLMRARKILATQKVGESIDFAKDLIAQDKKVVIVTCFTEVVKAVEKALKGNCVKLVGGMSDAEKDASVTEFQTGSAQVMVMNIIAGGVGVTLTASYNMVVNDFDWVSGNHLQAEDRICRGGQKESCCNIFYLYADGADMDEILADTLAYKSETINQAVDGGTGETLDFLDLLNEALEKSTGVKKVRRMVKVEDEEPETKVVGESKKIEPKKTDAVDFKSMTLDELWTMANKYGADCKQYADDRIQRMRLVMAIKAKM